MKSPGTAVPRLLALDLDNTLLRSDLSISYRTKNAIKRVQTAGITVVLASGRIPQAMDQFSRLLGLHKKASYLICNNGAQILESNTGKTVHEVLVEPRIALAVCNLADAEGFPVQVYEGDTMYVSRQNEYSNLDQKITGLRQVVVENFQDLIGKGCYKLIIPGDPMLLAPLESLIRTYLGKHVTLFTSQPYFLEILPPATDKGTALARIAALLGIRANESMAIGDSMNDEAMLKWAGTAVAMANADERIKSIADFVIEYSNNEDGVAEAIDKFLFGKRSANEQ